MDTQSRRSRQQSTDSHANSMLACTVLTVLSPGEQSSGASDARNSKPTSCWCVQMPLHVTSLLTSCRPLLVLGGACSCCSLLATSVMTYLQPTAAHAVNTSVHLGRLAAGGRQSSMQGCIQMQEGPFTHDQHPPVLAAPVLGVAVRHKTIQQQEDVVAAGAVADDHVLPGGPGAAGGHLEAP